MAAEKKSFQLGRSVTVTLPEAVADQVAGALSEVFGRPRRKTERVSAERLSVERIVQVAIDQMRERGYDAVTMRSIAKELGTGPASLYAHVANREDLDALVIDRVSAQLQVPEPDPQRWDDQLRQVCRDLLRLYRDHPGVARASMGMIPVQPGALVTSERILALLRAGRIPDQAAAWFVDQMVLFVGAAGVEEDIWRLRNAETQRDGGREVSEEAVVGRVRKLFGSLPPEHFPLLRSMATELTTGSGDERFEFGVDLLVEGLKAVSVR